ncbi:hypothetical protein HYY70_00315 [Candidatus Woesearchaeota archaeon]|nr:hypothetical protein [Candidatus Woesearchaeota archaeon]
MAFRIPFFKAKYSEQEFLPPPPPSPDFEFEKEKPKFFDEVIRPKKAEAFPEEEELGGLLQDMGSETKKTKISKKNAQKKTKQVKPIKAAPLEKKAKPEKAIVKSKQKPQLQLKPEKRKKETKAKHDEFGQFEKELGLGEDFPELGIDDVALKELNSIKDYPESQPKRPKELFEAEEEIRNAIQKIKDKDKPSFLSRLFGKEKKERLIQEEWKSGSMPLIQDNINKSREALMKFDLETAKKSYIEAMKVYNSMSPEDQAKVYREIRELYFERRSAEELRA